MAKIIRWGLIGASRIAAEWIIPAIKQTTDTLLVAVQGGDHERVAAYASVHGIPEVYTDIDALLAADIDAVYISNTNEKHGPATLKALRADKHVLCEKPMALTAGQAEDMQRVSRESGLVLGINHHLGAMNSHRKIREMVQDGVIGKLVSVRVMFGVLLPESSQGWRTESQDSGAGIFYDLTVHNANLLHFILGEKITRISAMSSNTGISAKGIEDTVAAIATTESGLLINFIESFNIPFAQTSLELHGTHGSLFATDVLLQRAGGNLYLHTGAGRTNIPIEHVNAYPRVIAAFNAAIREGTAPITDGAQGLYALRVAMAAKQSITDGKSIAIE